MTLWGVFISAFLIGFSGAMMPGPMLGVTIEGTFRKGYMAGPLVALGHGILEFILIIILAFGLKDFFANPTVAGCIGLFGGAFLAWMGYGMVKSSSDKAISLASQGDRSNTGGRNLILAGALVSVSNPYFILWWASTGIESIRQAYTLGVLGVLIFFIGHVLADLSWFSAISIAFSRGKKLFNDTVYRWVMLFLGIFIIIFSIYFMGKGLQMLLL